MAAPLTMAQEGQSLQLGPTEGAVGSGVSVYGLGYISNGAITIKFDSKDVATTRKGMFGRVNSGFIVPNVPEGTYTVTATSAEGDFGSATFTVIAKGSSSYIQTNPTVTLPPSNAYPTSQGPNPTSTWTYPYTTPKPKAASSGISLPLVGGIVAVAAAVVVVFFVLRRRRNADMSFDEEPSPSLYKPNVSTPHASAGAAKRPVPTTRYEPSMVSKSSLYSHSTSYTSTQTTRPTVAAKYGQPYNQPPTRPSYAPQHLGNMKICRHCRQEIREDYNVCPFCHKRLR